MTRFLSMTRQILDYPKASRKIGLSEGLQAYSDKRKLHEGTVCFDSETISQKVPIVVLEYGGRLLVLEHQGSCAETSVRESGICMSIWVSM